MGTPNTDPTVEIDLGPTRRLISAAVTHARDIDGALITRGNTGTRADTKRDLIYLSDLLSRAAAEAKVAYHAMNGYPDPLED